MHAQYFCLLYTMVYGGESPPYTIVLVILVKQTGFVGQGYPLKPGPDWTGPDRLEVRWK